MENHAVLIIEREGNILFIQRMKNDKSLPNMWSFPSGTQEEGEDILETAMREAKEELGVDVAVSRSGLELELKEFNVNLIFIRCEIMGDEIVKINAPKEIQRIEWMTFEEFFNRFSDDEIGHGLRLLRNNDKLTLLK